MSYEQWLRSLNMPEEAEKWRHRKNKRILLLERPDDTTNKEPQEYTGLSGFFMTVTKQGVKFASQDKPGAVAFVDIGRVIKVYDHSDRSILAALQLAQSKWGGVQVSGSDEYKRKCAELAAKNGIRIANPELRDYMKELERKKEEAAKEKEKALTGPVPFSELKKRWTALRAELDRIAFEIAEPRIAEAAKQQIEAETAKISAENALVYEQYLEAVEKRQTHAEKELPEPLLLGYSKWQREHEEWEAQDKAMRSRMENLWEKAGGNIT
jgi:ribosomal protein S10